MENIIIGIASLIGGVVLGWWSGAKALAPKMRQMAVTHAIDQANFLGVLRRELANILVWQNPKRYLNIYRELHQEIRTLPSLRLEEVRQRAAELGKKYPYYNDFDIAQTREHVLYADSVSWMGYAELESRYRDLVLFMGFSAFLDEVWKEARIHTTSDRDLDHLIKYVKRIEDTQLQLRIKSAMGENRRARRDPTYHENLDNDFFKIIDLPHFAELRYGIHFKQTNEFAIYSSFVFDDGRTMDHFFRSDPTFQKEEVLDPLSFDRQQAFITYPSQCS